MSKEDDNNTEDRQRKIEEAIEHYRQGHLDLIRIGIVLIESGQDLTGLKETIDGLGEREVKDLLAVTVAELAHF